MIIARRVPRTTAAVRGSRSSTVTGSVLSWPKTTIPAESPTSSTGMPASSKTAAVRASYEVSMGHFSPRALAAARSRTVTRRFELPPKSGSAVRALVAAASGLLLSAFIWILHVSWRRGGVPGRFDHRTPRPRGTGGTAGRPGWPRPGPAVSDGTASLPRMGNPAGGGTAGLPRMGNPAGGGTAGLPWLTATRSAAGGGNVFRYGVVPYR